jgi:hypothetical protein
VFSLIRRVVLPTLTVGLAFFAALAFWFIMLAVHSERRRRRD